MSTPTPAAKRSFSPVPAKKTVRAEIRKSAHGLINKIEGARVHGWAHDPPPDGSQTAVEFLVGGKLVDTVVASVQRLGLIEKGFPPNCGFSSTLPLPPGTHTVTARTKESGYELKNSPFTCTVVAPKGIPPKETTTPQSSTKDKAALRAIDVQPQISRVPAAAIAGDHPVRMSVGHSNVEAVIQSSSGAVLVIGWAIAHSGAIKNLTVVTPSGECVFAGAELGRSRRKDVEKAVSGAPRHKDFGLFGLGLVKGLGKQVSDAGNLCTVTIRFENGISRSQQLEIRYLEDAEFIDVALNAFSTLEFHGNRVVESFAALDGGLGARFIEIQAAHVKHLARAHACQRFGIAAKAPRATIIVCIYGRPEYQFLQNALFGLGSAAADYEFVYVSNSPELIDALHRAATISHRIYGLAQSVVALPANAGFGVANNIAANYASSRRLLFVNPDVFPRGDGWGNAHQAILDAAPKDQTTLFGARLFYSDGSLMHGGMHFDADAGISIRDENIGRRPLLRVEHFGKGAPPDLAIYRGSRPVPAVSGALMSVDRKWFELLNGFADDYIFGHYEDADFCLRSLERGVIPYVHDFEFWHLEGKGSTRLACHEAASTINRWHFTRTWYEKVIGGFPFGPPVVARPVGPPAGSRPTVRPPPVSRPAARSANVR